MSGACSFYVTVGTLGVVGFACRDWSRIVLGGWGWWWEEHQQDD